MEFIRKNTTTSRRTAGRSAAVLACVALFVAGCGGDDDNTATKTIPSAVDTTVTETTEATETSVDETTPEDTASDTTPEDTASDPTESTPEEPSGSGEPVDATTGDGTAVGVTLTDTSIDGLPTDLVAGLVDVTVTDETEGAGGEINFTLVAPGTDQETFAAGLAPIFEGGPFADYFLNNAGVAGSGTIALDEGEYIVWIDLASNLDRTSTVDDIVTTSLTVGAGDDGADISADGTVTATDYHFETDVAAGKSIVTFNNDSTEQFHHVVLVDFGTNDPALVESKLLELLESDENSPPPEGLDMSQVNFDFAGSGVFGPGGSGTFAADFEAGKTYVALCFIQDREGGGQHAVQHNMHQVFEV